MANLERCANAIAAVLCECCTVEEIEDTLAQINPADWNRAAEKCLEAANHRGAVEAFDVLRTLRQDQLAGRFPVSEFFARFDALLADQPGGR